MATQSVVPFRKPKNSIRELQPSSSRIRLEKSRGLSKELRVKMTFLRASLPVGALSIFSYRRTGRGWGIPTDCPFCDERPPVDMHRMDLRRRWQAAHIAMYHVQQGRYSDGK